MKKFISITAVVFLVLLMVSCEKFPKVSYYKIKVGPDKFATIKEVVTSTEEIARYRYRETGILYVKYNGIVFTPVDFKEVREDNLGAIGDYVPITIMEYNGKLYVVIMTLQNLRSQTVFDFFEQDGDKFRKITYQEFPKSIALKNFFKPGQGEDVDEVTGHKGVNHLDVENRWMNEPKEFDRNSVENFDTVANFHGSQTGDLWYYLENGENFKELNKQIPVEFFKSYIEKNNPVRMKVEEMKEITAEEAGFDKSK